MNQQLAVQNLFKSVICRCVQDALFANSFGTSFSRMDKQRAIEYLCGEHEKDLRFVCMMAGISADRVMKVSKQIFNGQPLDLSQIKNLKRVIK